MKMQITAIIAILVIAGIQYGLHLQQKHDYEIMDYRIKHLIEFINNQDRHTHKGM